MVVEENKGKECNLSVDLGFISASEVQISHDDEDDTMHTSLEIMMETPIQPQSPQTIQRANENTSLGNRVAKEKRRA